MPGPVPDRIGQPPTAGGHVYEYRLAEVRRKGAAAAAPRPARHRWDKTGTHRYRCRHCGTVKRNWLDPDTGQWFQTFQPVGGRPQRRDRVPTCGER